MAKVSSWTRVGENLQQVLPPVTCHLQGRGERRNVREEKEGGAVLAQSSQTDGGAGRREGHCLHLSQRASPSPLPLGSGFVEKSALREKQVGVSQSPAPSLVTPTLAHPHPLMRQSSRVRSSLEATTSY